MYYSYREFSKKRLEAKPFTMCLGSVLYCLLFMEIPVSHKLLDSRCNHAGAYHGLMPPGADQNIAALTGYSDDTIVGVSVDISPGKFRVSEMSFPAF